MQNYIQFAYHVLDGMHQNICYPEIQKIISIAKDRVLSSNSEIEALRITDIAQKNTIRILFNHVIQVYSEQFPD